MRRLLTLVCLLSMAIPAGISVSGCYRNPAGNYCNGEGFGLKLTAVASIDLEPRTTGISMAFGQTQQVSGATAKTCKGTAASVSSYTYGTTNNQLVDISPAGNLCAGTWNRNSGGGIPNYTICSFPNPLPNTGGLPYGSAYITASAQDVTSNPVQVFVHAQVSSVTLVGPQQCLSQGTLWHNAAGPLSLDAQACYAGANNKQYLLCAAPTVTANQYACPLPPGVASVPSCPASIGTLSYNVGNSSIAQINPENNEITAEQPGTTVITASIAGSGSSAGYFSTCPPQSISVTLNGADSGTVTQGVEQNLVTTVTDTNGNSITGLTLDYQSTNPLDITAGSGGGVSASFPGAASVYAICQPSSCNPSPINQVGRNGTGLAISSNPVTITTPGTASAFMWFSAPYQSQYVVPVELLTGTIGSPLRLPFVPNSMVMDQTGANLYFGSSHELMIVSTVNNTVIKQDPNTPGVVLAVAPNGTTILINDPVRELFYIYGSNGSINSTFGGLGAAAAWTPDAKTLYIADNASLGGDHTDTLYVYNANTGWTTYPGLPAQPQPVPAPTYPIGRSLAIAVPGVGAFLGGSPTVAHTWCPTGTVGDYASMTFYPVGDTVSTATDALAATVDGHHILGAAAGGGGIALSDIGIPQAPIGACPAPAGNRLQPLNIASTLNTATINANAATVNQVVAGSRPQTSATAQQANLAFITYSGSTPGATLPYYTPAGPGIAGTVGYVTLTGASSVTAPVAGAFSPDNTLFFVSTAGDNKIHYIGISPTGPPTDTKQISPNLPACTPVSAGGVDLGCIGGVSAPGAPVPTTAIAVKPRATT